MNDTTSDRDALAEVNDVARMLMAEWERVEGEPVNASYVATFADMARKVVERDRDLRGQAHAPIKALADELDTHPPLTALNGEVLHHVAADIRATLDLAAVADHERAVRFDEAHKIGAAIKRLAPHGIDAVVQLADDLIRADALGQPRVPSLSDDERQRLRDADPPPKYKPGGGKGRLT